MPVQQSRNRAIIFILISSLLAGLGQLLFKASTVGTEQYLDIFLTPWFYLGICCYTLATLFMILAFKDGELSILFPILSTTYVWTITISIYLFHDETINTLRVLGILLIMTGAAFLGIQQKRNTKHFKSIQE